MIFSIILMFSNVFAEEEECPPDNSDLCITGLGDFAVSRDAVIGLTRNNSYVEVYNGWSESTYSELDPESNGVKFSEIEGVAESTEWGCGVSATYGTIGNVMCWGSGTSNSNSHKPPEITNPGDGSHWQDDAPYSNIDLSRETGCAIGATGKVLVWTEYNNESVRNIVSGRPTVGGYTDCTSEDYLVCATGISNGGIDCWGDNYVSTWLTSPSPPTTGTYVDVSCRGKYCFGVEDDGTLDFFGYDSTNDFVTNAPTATNLVSIQLNQRSTNIGVALDSEGYAWVWEGSGSYVISYDSYPYDDSIYSPGDRLIKLLPKFESVKIEEKLFCGLLSEDFEGTIACEGSGTDDVSWKKGDLVCNTGTCTEVVHPTCPSE